ncbi:exopolygalacturonase precursor [Elaeis guineensis]|uniref:Exopolygalacturonase n=1 Tax=Elaeis guineensis var. tenera TaxID=51953 RepID=A1KXJ8_ELAGV|nr:oil palm polygalacturonase allergen PEST643 [Elaeis guineensis]
MELKRTWLISALLLLIFISNVVQIDGRRHGRGRLVGRIFRRRHALGAIAQSQTIQRKRIAAFNVKKFGAAADGKSDDSAAFLKAWETACPLEGRKKIVIPRGEYLVNPIRFEGPCNGLMEVLLSGVVKAQPDINVFNQQGHKEWITFNHIDRLLITGAGTFDGQGSYAWQHNTCSKKKDCSLLPGNLRLNFVARATVRGISVVDSKSFQMTIFGSNNVRIHRIKIIAPEEAPNTDGIHIGNSTNVRITDSEIGTGDDCISVGPGSRQILVSGVSCGPGHGISIGSLGRYHNEPDVSGVTVKNCTLTGTTNGLRVKTWQNSESSRASDFHFENVVMNGVQNPIIVDQEYCPVGNCEKGAPSLVEISNVTFQNIRGTSASRMAVHLFCSKTVNCKNVILQDIDLKFVDANSPSLAQCYYAQGTAAGYMNPPSCFS